MSGYTKKSNFWTKTMSRLSVTRVKRKYWYMRIMCPVLLFIVTLYTCQTGCHMSDHLRVGEQALFSVTLACWDWWGKVGRVFGFIFLLYELGPFGWWTMRSKGTQILMMHVKYLRSVFGEEYKPYLCWPWIWIKKGASMVIMHFKGDVLLYIKLTPKHSFDVKILIPMDSKLAQLFTPAVHSSCSPSCSLFTFQQESIQKMYVKKLLLTSLLVSFAMPAAQWQKGVAVCNYRYLADIYPWERANGNLRPSLICEAKSLKIYSYFLEY